MKKITLLLAAFLIASVTSFASNNNNTNAEAESVRTVSLSGKVLDMVTGEALAGVKVMVEETDDVSYTDFDGKFTFEGLIPGTYQLSTSLISYKSSDKKLELDNQEEIEVKLEQITE
jgi:protocatechuate 3,4-dioxygenase beta subunit